MYGSIREDTTTTTTNTMNSQSDYHRHTDNTHGTNGVVKPTAAVAAAVAAAISLQNSGANGNATNKLEPLTQEAISIRIRQEGPCPHGHHDPFPEGRATIFSCVINLANTIVGAGMLGTYYHHYYERQQCRM